MRDTGTTLTRVAGTLMFLAGCAAFMGIITAEALYRGRYSTGGNQISDLGGTQPPDSVVVEPSAPSRWWI